MHSSIDKYPYILLHLFATLICSHRCSIIENTKVSIVEKLQTFIHENNAYVNLFKTALERMPTDEYKVVIRADKTPHGEHQRRFNAPTFNEVAIVMSGNKFGKRDIVLQKRTGTLQHVADTHRSYDALQYPLMFWQGEDGYYFGIQQVQKPEKINTKPKKISGMDFYAYRLMSRDGQENHILKCRQLFHQFIVDMYAKIESERLLYIRLNQTRLRSEEYIHLRDAVLSDSDPNNLGKMVILPSSVTGSPRHMHEYTQDAMTYVKKYGRPDLFVTFTCNPSWPEITSNLLSGQKSTDRHDIIARVFKLKLTSMMNLITKSCVFGDTICWMYSIEWQKRGLPHAHILIWLKDKIRSTDIDKVISAELPNPEEDPLLFDVVTKNMIHGPCGNLNSNSPCMVNGHCSKKFPKQLLQETQTGEDGYPLYRRRKPGDGGFTATIRIKSNSGYQQIEVDNKWIVPYNPLLSKIFTAHINVEWCHSVKSIKYICKYVNKGSDQAVFNLHNTTPIIDEVQAFQLGRYISSNEAVWRILGMQIHERHPTVMYLSVHLENGQRVYFTSENIHDQLDKSSTTLTAFFKLCQIDSYAKTLLYCDIPQYYTWNSIKKQFERRKQGQAVAGYPDIRSSDALGRVYTVHPSNAECFYLRMLLHEVRGPTCFTDLRTVNGTVCESYREACEKLGLLENDNQWRLALEEASSTRSPNRIRQLFAIMLTTCNISDPLNLWDTFKDNMSEDILHQLRSDNPNITIEYNSAIYDKSLSVLEDFCLSMTGKPIRQYGMPSPKRDVIENQLYSELVRETNYNLDDLTHYVDTNEPMLTDDQRTAYDEILSQVFSKQGGVIFLDAPGGTGKTFLINLLLSKVRQQKEIAIAVASSGIAATLLIGGRTAHSAFKLPLNLIHSDSAVCDINKGTGKARVLEKCSVIVWDECTMAHKRALEALDRTLQDVRSNSSIMGGTVVLLAGDFRQTLPIIPRSTMADELNACLKASYLWKHVKTLKLNKNMRVHLAGDDDGAGTFSEILLKLGNGKLMPDPQTELIQLQNNFCTLVTTLDELINEVFPNIQSNNKNQDWLCERAILAPRNDNVYKLNAQIQNMIPGSLKQYKSIDTVTDPSQAVFYPVEFLNSLEPAGFPSHNLQLKTGSSIMLLRNLDPPRLCNGTRLCVKHFYPNVIEATIVTGCGRGDDVFIPRIPLIPTDLPFEFKRLQFPIRLAFAMTINKSQGQSMKFVGLDLTNPCFSHGQLYVGCSRVGNPKNLFILAPEGKTKNIVYKKALE